MTIRITYKNGAKELLEHNILRILVGGDAVYIGTEERIEHLSSIREIEIWEE